MFSSSLILAVIIFTMTAVNVHADSKDLKITSPARLQSYKPGDVISVKWSSAFSPSSSQQMVVNLLGLKADRYQIGNIIKKQNNGLYSVTWKIPADFFTANQISADSVNFRIEVKQGSNLRNRFISRGSLIKIRNNVTVPPVQNPNSGTVNTTPSTTTTTPATTLSSRSQFVAKYEFKSLYEPWVIKKLTVVNDKNNDGFNPNPSETTDAVDKVYIKYPDETGAIKIVSAPYANGKASFSGLDFYIPYQSSAYLELYVDTIDPKVYGQQFSGKTFRMGIQDSSNNSSTFEAVGQYSDTTLNAPGQWLQFSSQSINESVVKESVLTLAVTSQTSLNLLNGDNNLFDFTVTSGSASLGRLVFDVNQGGLTTLDGAKVYRNGQILTIGDASQAGDVYLMWDAGTTSCFAQLAQGGAGTGMDCNGNTSSSAKLILTFSKEEIISGTTAYRISFNAGGVSSGDSVTVRLDIGDDFAKPVISGSDTLNGKIYNGGVGPELFANPTDFASEATSITDRNIIWSDRSADSHNYPSISPSALPTSDLGSSADWTNGYLLGLNGLSAVTSSR